MSISRASRTCGCSHQCSPHYADTALRPTIEHLERAAGFRRDDAPAARLDKLEALLAQETDRSGEVTPLIAALLSIPLQGRYPPPAGTPQRQREATIEVLGERVTDLARTRPVLTVFEDLHWADPTTLELLDRLVGRIADDAGAAAADLPPGVLATLEGPAARDAGLAQPARPVGRALPSPSPSGAGGRCPTPSCTASSPGRTASHCSSRSSPRPC